jgi:hypothetical protein
MVAHATQATNQTQGMDYMLNGCRQNVAIDQIRRREEGKKNEREARKVGEW